MIIVTRICLQLFAIVFHLRAVIFQLWQQMNEVNKTLVQWKSYFSLEQCTCLWTYVVNDYNASNFSDDESKHNDTAVHNNSYEIQAKHWLQPWYVQNAGNIHTFSRVTEDQQLMRYHKKRNMLHVLLSSFYMEAILLLVAKTNRYYPEPHHLTFVVWI